MNKPSKESAKRRRQWAPMLTLTLLAAIVSAAMAEGMLMPKSVETIVGPMMYSSSGFIVTQEEGEALSPESGETHTVNYYLQEPAGGTWMHYFTEEREHGRLAAGPLYNPIDPTGNYEQVFAGWYEDEGCTVGPVNLLRMPVTADMSLYAGFGNETIVFEPEGFDVDFDVVITFTPILSQDGTAGAAQAPELGSELEPEENPEPDLGPIPAEIAAAISAGGEGLPENLVCTITAQVEGVPEGVYYFLQWQNDLSGELTNVPGETGKSITFPATVENLSCVWRLAIAF